MKHRIFTVLLVLGLCVGTASAQFGFGGIVYDPTKERCPQRSGLNAWRRRGISKRFAGTVSQRGFTPPVSEAAG
jgi:hypothetical protein